MFLRFFCASLLIIFIFGTLLPQQKNNVCKTFKDYYTNRDNNENCSFNPDIDLTVPEIIGRNGYTVEIHHVTTEDGYILTLFRIPRSKDSTDRRPRPPVFLQHGFVVNSAIFVTIGSKSLAFVLSDAGYDVWLGNYRGTFYSTNHTALSSYQEKYWDFSYDEIGMYDIPAQLQYIHAKTHQKIIYMGLSMGTTVSYVFATTHPEIARNTLKIIIGMAPVTSLRNVKLLSTFIPVWPLFKILGKLSYGRLFYRMVSIPKLLCLPYPHQLNLCNLVLDYFMGQNDEQIDPETMSATLIHSYDLFPIKMGDHWIQTYKSNNFARFDYGNNENLLRYGTISPPVYNFSNIQVPVYFIYGHNDRLVLKENVVRLYATIPKKFKPYEIYEVKDKQFSHRDFTHARDVKQILYEHIVDFIRKF